jgi:hypothetical protein
MKNIHVEIELNKVITVKSLKIPYELLTDAVKRNQYIREYFISLGYDVGYIRVC